MLAAARAVSTLPPGALPFDGRRRSFRRTAAAGEEAADDGARGDGLRSA
jgi:hypothetical protein